MDRENNDQPVTYHEQLIDFCRQQLSLGYMTHGVMGIRPLGTVPHDISHDNSYIVRLLEATAFQNRYGFLERVNGHWVDKGFYISVVASELVFHEGTDLEYYANGACRYGALIVSNYETTTNMSLGDDVTLRYDLSDNVRAELSEVGVVTFRSSVRHGHVVHSGVTPSLPRTDYHNLSNVRMVQIVIAHLNDAIESIYEDDIDPGMRRTLLEELVQRRLRKLKRDGVVWGYDYEIKFRDNDSEGRILLTLDTKYSLEGILVSASVARTEE